MKRRKLSQELSNLGWYKLREGANHEIWTNGIDKTEVPRHNEINEYTAKSILRKAKTNPPYKK